MSGAPFFALLLAATEPAPLPDLQISPTLVQEKPHESVYRVHPLIDGAVIVAGAATAAVPYRFSSSLIHPRCPCDPSEVNPIDRTIIGNHSEAADMVSGVSVAAAWLVPVVTDVVDVGVSHELLEDMVVYAEGLAVNGALVTLAKYSVQRPLPIVYAGLAPDLINSPRGYRSFYSGHTSNALTALMVASMTYTLRHGPAWWPWVVTGIFGFSIATERVLAGRHFYSDVAVGAFSGVLVGWTIPRLHE